MCHFVTLSFKLMYVYIFLKHSADHPTDIKIAKKCTRLKLNKKMQWPNKLVSFDLYIMELLLFKVDINSQNLRVLLTLMMTSPESGHLSLTLI